MATLEFFSEERIALNREIIHHPALGVALAAHADTDFSEKLAEICTYLGIAIDSYLKPRDVDKLCGILTQLLQQKRALIITSL